MAEANHESRGELALITELEQLLSARAAPSTVPFGDDMAALMSEMPRGLWTVDMLMDGVDFDSTQHDWATIGRKSMAVNLSDCAAMAACPAAALCAVSLADSLAMTDAIALIRGAHAFGQRFGCPIVGGDTNSWPHPTVISITVVATTPDNRTPIRRDGARPGDQLWLSGPVGGSILGRHLTFEPRVDLALRIADQLGPHAMIDISDGLALDLGRILQASRCGAVLLEDHLASAIHPDAHRLAAQDGRAARDHGLHDGEDFELIVVLPPDTPTAAAERLGLLHLGMIEADAGLWLAAADGTRTPIPIKGWEHFQ